MMWEVLIDIDAQDWRRMERGAIELAKRLVPRTMPEEKERNWCLVG